MQCHCLFVLFSDFPPVPRRRELKEDDRLTEAASSGADKRTLAAGTLRNMFGEGALARLRGPAAAEEGREAAAEQRVASLRRKVENLTAQEQARALALHPTPRPPALPAAQSADGERRSTLHRVQN